MFTYSVIFLLFVSTIYIRNLPEDHRQIWHKLVDELTDKFNIDNRHFNKEEMLLFPDVGFQSLYNNNTWKTMVHGWKYQTNKRKDWLKFSASLCLEKLAKNLVNQDDILYLNGSINHDRLRPFFVTDESNEAVTIQIGDKKQSFRTDDYGEFYEQIELTNDEMQQQRKGDLMNYEATGNDEQESLGIIRLIDPKQGISIISDIDDTIKISEVLDKVRLLANTFIFPFKSVPGMSDLYQQWQTKNPNCTFHYLSGMPDQLYTLTQEFINTNNFPDGSFHMRHFGWALTSLFDFLHSQSTFTHKISYLRFFFIKYNS